MHNTFDEIANPGYGKIERVRVLDKGVQTEICEDSGDKQIQESETQTVKQETRETVEATNEESLVPEGSIDLADNKGEVSALS